MRAEPAARNEVGAAAQLLAYAVDVLSGPWPSVSGGPCRLDLVGHSIDGAGVVGGRRG